ncbi:MAG: hypothetical protein ACK48E_03705, partial [Holosporales bacterium]
MTVLADNTIQSSTPTITVSTNPVVASSVSNANYVFTSKAGGTSPDQAAGEITFNQGQSDVVTTQFNIPVSSITSYLTSFFKNETGTGVQGADERARVTLKDSLNQIVGVVDVNANGTVTVVSGNINAVATSTGLGNIKLDISGKNGTTFNGAEFSALDFLVPINGDASGYRLTSVSSVAAIPTTPPSDGFNLVKGIDDDRVEILKGTDGADLFLRSSSKTGAIGDKLAPDIVVDFDSNKDFLRFTDPTITQLGFSEVYQPSAGRYVTNVWGLAADGTPLASFTVMAPRNEVEGRIQNSAGASITKVLRPTNITETDGDTSTIYNGDPNLQGTSGNDTLTGSPTWDVLRGKAGNDTLLSGGGGDGLLGGAGDDTLDGGSGNDVYVGYTGKDTFLIGANAGEDFIYDFNKSEGDIIKISNTRVTKVTVDETKTASGQFVTVVSGLDDKGTVLTKTFVNSSKDSLGGGIQDSDGEIIFGGSTTPETGTISGTDIAETIDGTENKDTIDGKGGNDLIYGKGGADTFLEGKTSGVDTIYKF